MTAVRQKLAKILANDPHGDTVALQMNPREAAVVRPILRSMGGADVPNQRTGMHQFYDTGPGGSGGPSGNGAQGGSRGDHTGAGNANGGGGNGGRSDRGGGFATGTTVGGMPNPDPYGANSPTGKALAAHGLDPAHVSAALGAQRAYVGASQAYAGRSGLQKAMDALAGLVPGVSTTKPNLNDPTTYAGGAYHQDFNPAGAAAAVAGFASGIPGASTLGELAAGKAYNAFGGNDYSFGGGGIDPQTGQSTSGWHGGGTGLGFGGPSGAQAPGNATGQQNGSRSLAETLAGSAKAPSVGTNAGTPSIDAAVPASYAQPGSPFVGATQAMNHYIGTPWPSYPGNVWIGGGTGSRALA